MNVLNSASNESLRFEEIAQQFVAKMQETVARIFAYANVMILS